MKQEEHDAIADAVVEACKLFVEKRVQVLVEALKLDERLAAIEKESGSETKLQSFEKRLSRHAEHLARLEDRVRALETGGAR